MRLWLAAIILLMLTIAGDAQLTSTFVGSNGGGGAGIPACGAGVIDLSTGCIQPMLGGL